MVSHCDTVSRQDMMFSCFDMRRTLFYRTRLSRLVTSFSFLFQKPTRESPEVAPTATHPPEEVRVLSSIGGEPLPIRGHQIHREQTIDGEPICAHQPADAPTQGESAQTRSRDGAGGGGQAVHLGLMHKFAQGESCLHTRDAPARIDLDVLHPREVDDERAVPDREPNHTMAATTDSDRQTNAAGEVDGGEDIIGVGAVHDQGGIPLNSAVPDAARSLITGITGPDHLTSQACLQLRNDRPFESCVHAHPSCPLPLPSKEWLRRRGGAF